MAYTDNVDHETHETCDDLAKAFNWTVWQTGGGCLAYRQQHDGFHILITDAEDGGYLPDTLETPVTLGFYDDDGEWYSQWGYTFPNLGAAVEWCWNTKGTSSYESARKLADV